MRLRLCCKLCCVLQVCVLLQYTTVLPQPEVRSKAVLLLYNVLYPKAEGEGEFGDPYYIMASAFCISAGAI